MGNYQSHTISVKDCDIWSGKPTREGDFNRGAVYFHNQNTDTDTANQRVVFMNNRIKCDDDIVMFIGDSSTLSGHAIAMDVEFIDNNLWSKTMGKADSIIAGNVFPSVNNTLAGNSFGNNVAKLNA